MLGVADDGAPSRVLGEIGTEERCRLVLNGASGTMTLAIPFCARRQWAAHPAGDFVVFAREEARDVDQAAVHFSVVGIRGDTIAKFVRGGRARRLDRSRVDSVVTVLDAQARRVGPSAAAAIRNRMPTTEGILQDLLVDATGDIWVVEVRSDHPDHLRVVRLARNGSERGSALTTEGVQFMAVVGDDALGVRRDPDGVPSVVALTVPQR